jgi:hypothetical protein
MLKFLLLVLSTISGGMMIAQTMAIAPAQANCAGGRPVEDADREALQRWNEIKDNLNYSFGQKVFDQIRDRRMILTPAFDRFTGPSKTQILRELPLNASSYEVYSADGRLISAHYDGCTPRTPLLTERDRFAWYMNRPPQSAPQTNLQEALRNAGNPPWRKVQVSIPSAEERKVRLDFWKTVGYAQDRKGWWIAWVPEGGYFEITVVNADDYLTKIKPFVDRASLKHRYVTLARDGTKLDDTRFKRGNPWQWILGKTSTPSGWQVKACPGEEGLLCVFSNTTANNNKAIGQVELKRMNYGEIESIGPQFRDLGITPGLITYDNPRDREKVLTALKDYITDDYKNIRANYSKIQGAQYNVVERSPQLANLGAYPGWVYGFSAVSKSGMVRERLVRYIAFDSSYYFYVITLRFDSTVPDKTFQNLANFDQFTPHLQTIVTNLKLPHPDW